jgi:demethylmenaquinone methyltransferase/2-methoxy-6-polyprenyl-1,4-benzoquinol methylase
MVTDRDSNTTHFGFETVSLDAKARRVRDVFDSVASNYDLMNDLMSGGLHRFWKYFALNKTALRPGDLALDVAGGTGDLTAGLSRQVGPSGMVFLTDINRSMLKQGRRNLINKGVVGNIALAQADAEKLPFRDNCFHCITIGFGLRNVTDKKAALSSMARTLKPGGRLLILEFSKPVLKFIQPIYDFYSFNVLPILGELIAGDADSYQYLAESIRMHPGQEELVRLMTEAGLEDSHFFNLSGGIVALHMGYKY